MSESVRFLSLRRYQILTVICALILALLLICLDASSWRTIETNETKLLLSFYLPLKYDASRTHFKSENRTFQLNIGPLWRCLTTQIPAKFILIHRECTINNETFDYITISIGIGTFLIYTIISMVMVSGCITNRIQLVRLIMSLTLELASLWLIYGFFHIQKVSGPLYGWASIGFFVGLLGVLIICVLEWDDYFREIYRTSCSSTALGRNARLHVSASDITRTEIDQI